MASENNIRNPGRLARIREPGRHRLGVRWYVIARWRGRERRRLVDESAVVLQPLAVVKGDSSDDAALLAEGGGETKILDRALGEDDLISEGAHANALDVDAELAGPELRQRQVRAASGLEVDHVVRRGLCAEYRGIHVFDRHELIFVEHMRCPRDVACDEDVVGHDAV